MNKQELETQNKQLIEKLASIQVEIETLKLYKTRTEEILEVRRQGLIDEKDRINDQIVNAKNLLTHTQKQFTASANRLNDCVAQLEDVKDSHNQKVESLEKEVAELLKQQTSESSELA